MGYEIIRKEKENMKSTKAAVYKRKQQILIELKKHKRVLVENLSEELQVSPITIRRDLDEFQKKGIVKRFYGGAELIQGALLEDPTRDTSDKSLLNYKQAIAREAAELIENGDTVFLNSSSTALLILEYLKNKRVTVITNNGRVIEKEYDPLVEIVLTGGEISGYKRSLVGDFALQIIRKVRADKCFLGVSGITGSGEVSTAILQETMINSLMMEQTNNMVVFLADHRKIGVQNNFIIGNIEQVKNGYIITDEKANSSILSSLENKRSAKIKRAELI